VGISGASGVQYGVRLLQVLQEKGCFAHLVVTDSARKILEIETDLSPAEIDRLASRVYRPHDFAAPIASGSYLFDAMVVIPCSMEPSPQSPAAPRTRSSLGLRMSVSRKGDGSSWFRGRLP